MEMQNIVIFVLIGAICMFIITGGVISMTSDTEPTPANLVSGAAVGGALGAALSYLQEVGPQGFTSMDSGIPEMKVGLPSF
jgi:hypothetical protein